MAIPVDRLAQVTAARCTSCMSCVDACPSAQEQLALGPAGTARAALVPGGAGRDPARLRRRAPSRRRCCFRCRRSSSRTRSPRPPKPPPRGSKVTNLTCRGRANLLFWFIERDDLYALPGYVKLEAWPGPGAADVHVTYDPAKTNEEADQAGDHRALLRPVRGTLARVAVCRRRLRSDGAGALEESQFSPGTVSERPLSAEPSSKRNGTARSAQTSAPGTSRLRRRNSFAACRCR